MLCLQAYLQQSMLHTPTGLLHTPKHPEHARRRAHLMWMPAHPLLPKPPPAVCTAEASDAVLLIWKGIVPAAACAAHPSHRRFPAAAGKLQEVAALAAALQTLMLFWIHFCRFRLLVALYVLRAPRDLCKRSDLSVQRA